MLLFEVAILCVVDSVLYDLPVIVMERVYKALYKILVNRLFLN
jgi:hypothetical protein